MNDLKADVINLSLGFSIAQCDGNKCPLCQHINAYTQMNGILFVSAAGNRCNENTIDCPGKAHEGITVGAVNQSSNQVAAYCSKGVPGVRKPNILTSGSIYFNQEYDEGTSFAAPIVSGVCAAVLSGVAGMNHVDMKNLLYNNATDIKQPTHHQGFGTMNLEKMLEVLSNATDNRQNSGQGQN